MSMKMKISLEAKNQLISGFCFLKIGYFGFGNLTEGNQVFQISFVFKTTKNSNLVEIYVEH